MGRTSRGVRGVKLKEGDEVVGMVVAAPDAFLLTTTINGYGKRTPMEDYPIKGRGGQGVLDIKTTDRNGPVVRAKFTREGDDVMYITESGMIVRTPVSEISSYGRNTQGVRLVNLKDGDSVVSVEIVRGEDMERFADDGVDEGDEAEGAGGAAADAENNAESTGDGPAVDESPADEEPGDEE